VETTVWERRRVNVIKHRNYETIFFNLTQTLILKMQLYHTTKKAIYFILFVLLLQEVYPTSAEINRDSWPCKGCSTSQRCVCKGEKGISGHTGLPGLRGPDGIPGDKVLMAPADIPEMLARAG